MSGRLRALSDDSSRIGFGAVVMFAMSTDEIMALTRGD